MLPCIFTTNFKCQFWERFSTYRELFWAYHYATNCLEGQISPPHFDGQFLFCFSHMVPEMRQEPFHSTLQKPDIGCVHISQTYGDSKSAQSYSSRIKVDCLDALACASIAWEAFARLCCFARRDVSIVYAASKIRERAIFMLSTIL